MGACAISPEGPPLDGAVLPWLKSRKMRKFMGKQDELAVVAAGQAFRMAGLEAIDAKERIGVYLAVGYIPFERADIEPLALSSMHDGRFSMPLFSTVGIAEVNPLLTFRCLPNMPIFHVSLNLGICGPYFVTYPGVGQFYLALERAVTALRCGDIDSALVGGVADQNNFLVDYHFRRAPGWNKRKRHDVGAVLCLERRAHAARRGARTRAELLSFDVRYQAHDPLHDTRPLQEAFSMDGNDMSDTHGAHLGPGSLAAALCGAAHAHAHGELRHAAATPDGFTGHSRWRLA